MVAFEPSYLTNLPVILAIAERDRCPGTEIIRAVALSFEVQGRMRVASAAMMLKRVFINLVCLV